MNKQDWQLNSPLDAILFDCDGTLSSIEGIDELAALAGPKIAEAVKTLTAEAMGKTGINPEVFQQRLKLVAPTKTQVDVLGENYFMHRTPDTKEVITMLQQCGKSIYILSAGLFPAVAAFGERLHIPSQNVFAVGVQFDQDGHYQNFDQNSPLVHNHGKRVVVEHLKKKHAQLLYVGDGLNDIVVRDLVTRFVGYGGTYYRKNIAEVSDFYIMTKSMLPLLPLALTESESQKLSVEEKQLFDEGRELLQV